VGLVIYAAGKVHLEVVRWAIDRDAQNQKGYPLTAVGGEARLTIHTAAVNGHLQVAKYLRAHAQAPMNDRERELEAETQNWLREFISISSFDSWGKVLPVSGETMTLAAGNGHLDLVKWLFEEYGEDPAVNLFCVDKKEREGIKKPLCDGRGCA